MCGAKLRKPTGINYGQSTAVVALPFYTSFSTALIGKKDIPAYHQSLQRRFSWKKKARNGDVGYRSSPEVTHAIEKISTTAPQEM